MQVCKACQPLLSLQIYSNNQLQMVLLSCQNPSFHFTTSCKILRFTFSESRFILCPEFPKTGRKGFSNHAMICSFIVMKCEGFSMITDLVDYLNNNLLIAHYCGFDISAPLPSYWTFNRFLKQLDNDVLSSIMKSQVLYLSKQGIVDTSFIGLDSTLIAANTSQNNPKSFLSNKFKPDNQPKADTDCKLGVHTASNQTNEKKYEFYWGYKNHVLVDCIQVFPFMN